MSSLYGSQSMVDPLRRVLVRPPDDTFGAADPAEWHYTARPDLSRARDEHAAFVALLEKGGAEVVVDQRPLPYHADALFVHDPILVSDQGVIELRMGKRLRRGEEANLSAACAALGIPLHARLSGAALGEGGDCLWLDGETLAVGQGFRTNRDGLAQLQTAVGDHVQVIPVPLPYFTGPEACLHLMSFISLVDHDLAVVYPPLMPVPFWQLLTQRGYRFVEVSEREFWTMGPNVLALAPGLCLMLAGNPDTQKRLENAGCEVWTYVGEEISLKAEGGATCLTRPLWRA